MLSQTTISKIFLGICTQGKVIENREYLALRPQTYKHRRHRISKNTRNLCQKMKSGNHQPKWLLFPIGALKWL